MKYPAVALVLAVLWIGGAAHGLELARDGNPAVTIVVAREAIEPERTAAAELAAYLGRVTSATFAVVTEPGEPFSGPAIYVGPTDFSARAGSDAAGLGGEEWWIRTAPGGLILTGGRPRGTLYAVYRFLEDEIGVRWWTPVAESVPTAARLEIPATDVRGKPSFAYRDVTDIGGPPQFCARNRLNGHWSLLPWSYGGCFSYGPPYHVHTFDWYVPAEEYFDGHPEYFSEIEGVRTAEHSQLCLTNPDLLRLVADKLRGFIVQDRQAAAARGVPPSRLFDISPNDWASGCTCAACRQVVEREGRESAPLLGFVNELAREIEPDYPNVLINTLAYINTFHPPATIRPRDNVVVRLSALHRRDFSKPITHRTHREYREALDGWAARTTLLWVWDYSVSYGKRSHLPLMNLPVMAEDFRYYLAHGVSGLYIENEFPILDDMRELKVWVLAKLAEDPSRDWRSLVHEFTEGYYGPAGEPIRGYLDALQRSVARHPARIRYLADPEEYRFLTPAFLVGAQERFDEAERRVAHDPVLLSRVRFARLSLDRAMLMRWSDKLARRLRSAARQTERAPLEAPFIAERYRAAAYDQIGRLYPNGAWAREREAVDRDVTRLLRWIDE